MGQDDLLGQRLDQLDQPLVAGGGLDDGPERAQAAEEVEDRLGLAAGEGAAVGDLAVLVHDAEDDSLLVEVDADVVHGSAPVLWGQEIVYTSRSTTSSGPLRAVGSTSPLIVSWYSGQFT